MSGVCIGTAFSASKSVCRPFLVGVSAPISQNFSKLENVQQEERKGNWQTRVSANGADKMFLFFLTP